MGAICDPLSLDKYQDVVPRKRIKITAGAREAPKAVTGSLPAVGFRTRQFVSLTEALAVRAPRGHMRPRNQRFIYALVDPRDNRVRYVGVTRCKLSTRLERHLENPTNGGMRRWFRELDTIGKRPHAAVLEVVDDNEWEDAERGWIYWFRKRGDLLNVDPGGEFRDKNGNPRTLVLGAYADPAMATKNVNRRFRMAELKKKIRRKFTPNKRKAKSNRLRDQYEETRAKSGRCRRLTREEIVAIYGSAVVQS